MASKKTVNAENLEALGAQRLAALLLEIGAGDATVKRRLRLELAGNASPAEAAAEIRKRLATIARSRGFVDRQKIRTLVDDLRTQQRVIVDQVAKSDSVAALDLMWRFLDLANAVLDRCDDSDGAVSDVFQEACRDLGAIAGAAKASAKALADRVFAAIQDNGYGQYDSLIEVLAPHLGQTGLARLKSLVVDLSQQPVVQPAEKDRKVIGWSMQGPIHADTVAGLSRHSAVRLALEQIADAEGDVDGFIAQQPEKARKAPAVAVEIARRLMAAGRVEEALTAIDAIERVRDAFVPNDWEQLRAEILDALGRADEAQDFRWKCFEATLDSAHLRAFLKRLPDFEDVEAETRALAQAMRYRDVHAALSFLVEWPALDKAAQLVMDRARELDGDFYEFLAPAANALDARHPLAATILRRAMIEFALVKARASRYRHAARHLLECASFAATMKDFGALEPHNAWVARLKAAHARKSGFWSLVS